MVATKLCVLKDIKHTNEYTTSRLSFTLVKSNVLYYTNLDLYYSASDTDKYSTRGIAAEMCVDNKFELELPEHLLAVMYKLEHLSSVALMSVDKCVLVIPVSVSVRSTFSLPPTEQEIMKYLQVVWYWAQP